MPSPSFGSFMSERVPLTRWQVYGLRVIPMFVLGIAIGGNALSVLVDHPGRVLTIALLLPLLSCGSMFWTERHGRGTRTELAVVLAILLILLAILWYGYQRHKRGLLINSGSHAFIHTLA